MCSPQLKLVLVPRFKDDIVEMDCSSPDYWEEGDEVIRKDREFIPDLTLYRYRDCSYTNSIELLKFRAIRETEASYLVIDDSKERWIRKKAVRSFCYDAKKDAWRNFKKRKEKHLQILTRQARHIEQVIKRIKEIECDNG